jgi:hypothetical protein
LPSSLKFGLFKTPGCQGCLPWVNLPKWKEPLHRGDIGWGRFLLRQFGLNPLAFDLATNCVITSTLVTLPHKFIILPLSKPILPNEGIIAGFPKIFQLSSVIIFTCVSSSKTQSMSKSFILVLMHCFTFRISGKLTYL